MISRDLELMLSLGIGVKLNKEQVGRLHDEITQLRERVKELEDELDIAIDCIEQSGIDYDEVTEQLRKGDNS